MQPEVELGGFADVVEQSVQVTGELSVVELRWLFRLEGGVACGEPRAHLAVPTHGDVVPRPLLEGLASGAGALSERRVRPCGQPQYPRGRQLLGRLVTADHRHQAGVHVPVHEARLERLGGNALLLEHSGHAGLHRFAHQPLGDRRRAAGVVGTVELPVADTGRLEARGHMSPRVQLLNACSRLASRRRMLPR